MSYRVKLSKVTSLLIYTWNYINDAWPKYSQFIKLTMNHVEAGISLPFLLLFNSWYCVISWHVIQILFVDLCIWNCFFFLYRQQGGIIIAGPGVNNISYIHKVDFLSPTELVFRIGCCWNEYTISVSYFWAFEETVRDVTLLREG